MAAPSVQSQSSMTFVFREMFISSNPSMIVV